MKRIPLTQGHEALVDDCDYEYLMQWKWGLLQGRSTKQYANRGERKDGEYRKILMHREVMRHCDLEGMEVDHINQDSLDNRRSNLRVVTKSKNQHNSKVRKDSTTGIRGVSKKGSRFIARIQIEKDRKYLGTFDTVEQAEEAVNGAKRIFATC